MADAYRRNVEDSRQQQIPFLPNMVNRARINIEVPSSHHVSGNSAHEDEVAGRHVTCETVLLGEAYDHYLHTLPPYGSDTGRYIGLHDDLPEIDNIGLSALLGKNPVQAAPSRFVGVDGQPVAAFPLNASSTLVCLQIAPAERYLFRPFVGYEDLMIVNLDPTQSGGDPVVLCIVDFQCPAHAATALAALQGYMFDDHDQDSGFIRLQFACSS